MSSPEEGDPCHAEGCTGTLVLQRDGDCSCHINPPCGSCTEARLVCSECGAEPEE